MALVDFGGEIPRDNDAEYGALRVQILEHGLLCVHNHGRAEEIVVPQALDDFPADGGAILVTNGDGDIFDNVGRIEQVKQPHVGERRAKEKDNAARVLQDQADFPPAQMDKLTDHALITAFLASACSVSCWRPRKMSTASARARMPPSTSEPRSCQNCGA